MNKVHLIADETLGGVEREYVEVDRKAIVGDYVLIVDAHCTGGAYNDGDILKVSAQYAGIIYCMDIACDGNFDGQIDEYEYNTLEPTDIVHVWETAGDLSGLVRYRLVERKAKVGEKVIIAGGGGWYGDKVGHIYPVINAEDYDFRNDETYVDNEPSNSCLSFVFPGDYLVLEPATSESTAEELTLAIADSPESMLDLLANLARRVTSLEQQLKDTQGNVERQSQEVEQVRHNVEGLAQITKANSEDIVDLDERTQPKDGETSAIQALQTTIQLLCETISKQNGGVRL